MQFKLLKNKYGAIYNKYSTNSNQFSNHLRKLTFLKDCIMKQLLKLKENKNKKYKILYMNLELKLHN